MRANIFDTWPSLVYRWIVEAGAKLPEHAIFGEVKHMEFDEMWPFVKSKNKLWVIKAVDRCQRRTVVWVLGNRDSATFQRLYEKVKHLTDCTFYTDNWDAFAKSLPPERHVIGKSGTHGLERDNSNTRHHLDRFTRKTKVVSKKDEKVDTTLKLWQALTDREIFKQFQAIALYIHR